MKKIMMDHIFIEHTEKNASGKLTVGEAFIGGYYRLLEGEKAGRVIILTCAKIDGKPIGFFANGLTHFFIEDFKNIRCEISYPSFSPGTHAIDRSLAAWYDDNGDGPRGYEL